MRHFPPYCLSSGVGRPLRPQESRLDRRHPAVHRPLGRRQDHPRRHRPRGRVQPGHRLPGVPRRQGQPLEATVRRDRPLLRDRGGRARRPGPTSRTCSSRAWSTAARLLCGHAALQYLLAHEPEVVLPLVAFTRMDRRLRGRPRLLRPLPRAATSAPTRRPGPPSGWPGSPSPTRCARRTLVDLSDEDSVRRLVRAYVLPGLVPTVSTAPLSATKG